MATASTQEREWVLYNNRVWFLLTNIIDKMITSVNGNLLNMLSRTYYLCKYQFLYLII